MLQQYEILDSTYSDDTKNISVFLGLKHIEEVNPPPATLPGDPVDNTRWIRRVTEIFTNEDLEVHTSVISSFGPGDVVLYLADVSRLPNFGTLVFNRGSVNEESISYTGRDRFTNTITGISDPIYTHVVSEIVYPNVNTGFLGTFEVDLETSFTGGVRGPLRYGKTTAILNDVITLREGKDFDIVNNFIGDVCTRTQLRFNEGGHIRRFNPQDRLVVTYEFFVLYGDSRDNIQYYSAPDVISYISLYQRETANIAFGTLESSERETTPVGNIQIVPPPTGNTVTTPPLTARILIRDIKLPTGITITAPIGLLDTTIAVSDISLFPTPGTLSNSTDDLDNRSILIDGDNIFYTDIDKINRLLVGVSGISATHATGALIEFNGAKYVRDTIKNLINNHSILRGRVEALGVDVSGYFLQIKVSSATGSLNLQSGTYALWYLGFDDNYDAGLHRDITSSVSFENKDFTFACFQEIVSRQDVAKTLLGQTTSTRSVLSGTSPTDTIFDIP